jgi:copper chaperone
MHCANCILIVERQLKDNNGIKEIEISYITDSVKVEYDPNLIIK